MSLVALLSMTPTALRGSGLTGQCAFMERLEPRLFFASAPDLTPFKSSLFGLPDHMEAGEYHAVFAQVTNLGGSKAPSFATAFYLSPTKTITPDSVLVDSSWVPDLAPLATTD